MAKYTKQELRELPTVELAKLAGVTLSRGRPSREFRESLVEAAYAAGAKKK
jgi:hypothetical protein